MSEVVRKGVRGPRQRVRSQSARVLPERKLDKEIQVVQLRVE